MIRIFSQYVSPKSFLLIGLETVLIALSLLIGARLRYFHQADQFSTSIQWPAFGFQVLVIVVVLQVCFYYSDVYSFASVRHYPQLIVGLTESLGAACLWLG